MSNQTNGHVGFVIAEDGLVRTRDRRTSVDGGRNRLCAESRQAAGVYRTVVTFFMLLYSLLATSQATETVTYYYTSPQGTVLAAADSAGTALFSSDYRPYGSQALGAPQGGPGYTGHVIDIDSGLVYMQARYYDPAIGRFISVDPSGRDPGDQFAPARFSYASNNPIVNVDPNGKQSVPGYYLTGTDFRSPATREFAFNTFVPGYAAYGCATNGCSGSEWTIAVASTFLSVAPAGEAMLFGRAASKAATPVSIAAEAGRASTAEKGAANFFRGSEYSPKVLGQMSRGPGEFHSFPESVTAFAEEGTVTQTLGGDGRVYQTLEIPGAYSSTSSTYNGVFQFIKDDQNAINHRLFVPDIN